MTIVTLRRPPGTFGAIRGAGEKSALGRISRCGHTIDRWIARSRQRRALRDIAEIDYLLISASPGKRRFAKPANPFGGRKARLRWDDALRFRARLHQALRAIHNGEGNGRHHGLRLSAQQLRPYRAARVEP